MVEDKKEKRGRRGRRTKWMEDIARERIKILLNEAEEAAKEGRMEDAERYAQLARAIGMRYNIRLTPFQKRFICKECGAYLVPGVNLHVRISRGKIISTCACGAVTRIHLKKRKKETNQENEQLKK